jgi:UDP-N-acetylglucosamine--N-acetylmuramyl-(pentapeptide) pyrophosphoryl-undecaprenol N-acetylglucosamine transferase
MLKRIMFAAGGTGGHIYPAIAVADELKKLDNKIEIKFVGAKGRIEENIVPANGYELLTIDLRGFYRSLSPKNVGVTLKFLRAVRKSNIYLKEFRPEIVFGTGGFVSGPVLWSASKLRIPTVIQEGNSYPGITVKWLSPKADKVILNFEETKKYLKRQDNIVMMPYPVRANLVKYSKDEALKYFGLSQGEGRDRKTIFVFGGSQGAGSINKALLKCFRDLLSNNIQIIWQTGENFYDKIQDEVKLYKNVKVLKYVESIDYAYSAADLIICRSGISTVMELASFGCAAVFVPFSLASENHQEKNANSLADKGAAEMILDKELDQKLQTVILKLINDDKKLDEMKKNILKFADKEAAGKMALLLIEMVNSSKN